MHLLLVSPINGCFVHCILLVLFATVLMVGVLGNLIKSPDEITDKSLQSIDGSNTCLSLFAESLYEMLQYQMGCRLLTFLEKSTRREEINENDKGKSSSSKCLKTSELPVKLKSSDTEVLSTDQQQGDQNTVMADDTVAVSVNELKMEQETDEEEDPEEDPEEYEGSEVPGSDVS